MIETYIYVHCVSDGTVRKTEKTCNEEETMIKTTPTKTLYRRKTVEERRKLQIFRVAGVC